ncbi:hypothetical protein JX265_010640 [Neoarthrinium moseri]|uniref:Uncharacterized protein n=1 Tax=Neoarthrinium moseri TaxID=1658444 RepID=A0A9P9WE90_9PEZI|nr:hypothetical protein JX265_010640 [Neoarthrinium moseri]
MGSSPSGTAEEHGLGPQTGAGGSVGGGPVAQVDVSRRGSSIQNPIDLDASSEPAPSPLPEWLTPASGYSGLSPSTAFQPRAYQYPEGSTGANTPRPGAVGGLPTSLTPDSRTSYDSPSQLLQEVHTSGGGPIDEQASSGDQSQPSLPPEAKYPFDPSGDRMEPWPAVEKLLQENPGSCDRCLVTRKGDCHKWDEYHYNECGDMVCTFNLKNERPTAEERFGEK